MSEFKIAHRYAKSLSDLAEERNILEQVHQDMQLFISVCENNRALALMLRNPIIARDAKLRTLRQLFEGKVQELTLAFFEIIVRKQREDVLLSVAREFHLLYNAVKHIDNALLITAVPVSEAVRQRIIKEVKEITGHEVDLTEKVDPEIIGGFVLRINDKQIDDSVRSRIDELRYLFSKNPYIKEF